MTVYKWSCANGAMVIDASDAGKAWDWRNTGAGYGDVFAETEERSWERDGVAVTENDLCDMAIALANAEDGL